MYFFKRNVCLNIALSIDSQRFARSANAASVVGVKDLNKDNRKYRHYPVKDFSSSLVQASSVVTLRFLYTNY